MNLRFFSVLNKYQKENGNLLKKGGEKLMDKYLLKLGTAVSSAAIVAASFLAPAMAVTIEVSGNGSDSDNTVNYTQENEVEIEQENEADITNNIEVDANSGNNEAEDNTGGDVTIKTGKAEANVTVNNSANLNQAEVNACCPGDVEVTISGNGSKSDNDVTIETGDAEGTVTVSNNANANVAVVGGDSSGGSFSVWVTGNGADSDNTVNLDLENEVEIEQENEADIENDIEVDAESGDNEAEDNTGGDVSIETGDADATVDVTNTANLNWADVDSCGCIVDGSVKVSGNGADSNNDVILDLESELEVDQDNEFECGGGHGYRGRDGKDGKDNACNDIEAESNTGDNEAEDNTHFDGDPSIQTGDASSDVDVNNEANVNKVGDVDLDGENIDIDINLEGLLALLLGLLD